MTDQPIVPQKVIDMLDGKSEQPKPQITGNQRLNQEMQKIIALTQTAKNL